MDFYCAKCEKMTKVRDEMYFRTKRQKVSTICKECFEIHKAEHKHKRKIETMDNTKYNPNPSGHPLFYNQIFGCVVGNKLVKGGS